MALSQTAMAWQKNEHISNALPTLRLSVANPPQSRPMPCAIAGEGHGRPEICRACLPSTVGTSHQQSFNSNFHKIVPDIILPHATVMLAFIAR